MRWLISLFFTVSSAWALRFGEQCDPYPFYSASWQYQDSCAEVSLYCDPGSRTCQYKGCSNSDYIRGWPLQRPMPPRCNSTTFCPDDNSHCKPLVPIGAACEPQRDDECAGKNAICLNNTCFIKGAPLGGQCGADKTTYASLDAEQETIQQTIIRDNCTLGTYCNIPTGLCIESKPNGQYCEQDRECLSGTCSNDYVCINGPEVFHTIKPWLWGVLGAAVVIFVLVILGALWILHRYQSKKEHAKIMAFFGDNEEFAKYVDHDENTSVYENDQFVNDSRTSVVYLTTPDYVKSSALSTSSWRNSSAAKLREASPRTSGSFTPSGNRTLTPEPR